MSHTRSFGSDAFKVVLRSEVQEVVRGSRDAIARLRGPRRLVPFFATAIGVGAVLLFLVQPMVGKLLLPRLGGAPGVWNACMVFFQAMLLLGYGYAHLLGRLPLKVALPIHAAVLLLPLAILPIAVPPAMVPPEGTGQAWWVLQVLALRVGLPFFAVASASPLLQRWFSESGEDGSSDPYFLYVASNLGSIGGLLAYPLILEPLLDLSVQAHVWRAVYLLFVGAVITCGVLSRDRQRGQAAPAPVAASPAPTWRTRGLWVALAFVPSSLMLGVTHYLSTDVAAVPLLWVIPLVLYLLSFVVVFAKNPPFTPRQASRRLPLLVTALCLAFLFDVRNPIVVLLLLHLGGLFLVSLVCHGRLAESRPGAEHLTEFYLWLSVGGVLGGAFNALLAPVAFDAYLEYPLVLILACALRHPRDMQESDDAVAASSARDRGLDVVLPLGILGCYLLLRFALADVLSGPLARLVILVVPGVACYCLLRARRVRFALGAAVLLGIAFLNPTGTSDPANRFFGEVVAAERSFFGVHRVVVTGDGRYKALMHGTTVHGLESLEPEKRGKPLVYFFPEAPLGSLLTNLRRGHDPRLQEVGIMGLGCGVLASYSRPGERWTFFEIDAEVDRMARAHFSFLRDAQGECPTVLGDGRLSLERKVEPGSLGLLVMDSFSSDAIPVHLLTREAVELYVSRLQPRGLLVFNATNRFFHIRPLLGALTRELGLVGCSWLDETIDEEEGRQACHWVVMARTEEHLRDALQGGAWTPLPTDSTDPVWTDSHSNILSVMGR